MLCRQMEALMIGMYNPDPSHNYITVDSTPSSYALICTRQLLKPVQTHGLQFNEKDAQIDVLLA